MTVKLQEFTDQIRIEWNSTSYAKLFMTVLENLFKSVKQQCEMDMQITGMEINNS